MGLQETEIFAKNVSVIKPGIFTLKLLANISKKLN